MKNFKFLFVFACLLGMMACQQDQTIQPKLSDLEVNAAFDGETLAEHQTSPSQRTLTSREEQVAIIDPGTLVCNDVIDFNDLATGNYDGIIDKGFVKFAERFSGQTVAAAGSFDVLSGTPNDPISLQVGDANKNLHVTSFGGSQVIDGLGPSGFPNFNAIGEGAISFMFNYDQSELAITTNGSNNGVATASFFRRDGSLIETKTLSLGVGAKVFAFRRAGEVNDIAGVSITNTDGGGINYDNLTFCEVFDTDGDGCYDPDDPHPNSILDATVIIDGCDSGVPNVFPVPCSTMSDLIADCAASAGNHGEFVSCVSALSNQWKADGLITGAQKGAIQSCAAQANLP